MGVACGVRNESAAALRKDRALRGSFVGDYVGQVLRRQAGRNDAHIGHFYFRSKEGREVATVLGCDGRQIAGTEAEFSGTGVIRPFWRLRELKEPFGHRFTMGVELYDGEETVSPGENLAAVARSCF